MTIGNVYWFLDLFNELGITVWIDGGWGVDALLGDCTRCHKDLDIMIPWADSRVLIEALLERGFVHIYDDDRKDCNFVMTHRSHGRIDFHVGDLMQGGVAVYSPGEIDWVVSESELNAEGSIGGRKVRCLSADYQVRAHSGYTLQDTDFAEMSALHRQFGVELLAEKIKGDG